VWHSIKKQLKCSGRVSSSCSTSDTRRIIPGTNPVINCKSRKGPEYDYDNGRSSKTFYLRNKSWKPECVLSFNMGWRIQFTYIRQPMLKLKAHSGFNELFRFWYVYEYKYGNILWLEDGHLYLRLRTMSHTIYAAKFEQTIIHQHVHLRRESQSHEPAHVLMRIYPIDKSLVCLQSERRTSC
jgi:hypothetical protein